MRVCLCACLHWLDKLFPLIRQRWLADYRIHFDLNCFAASLGCLYSISNLATLTTGSPLTIISLSCGKDATKAVTPSCEYIAEMNRLESAMWRANAQQAATERGNISWVTDAVSHNALGDMIQSVWLPTESQMTVKHMLKRIRSNTCSAFCVAYGE